MTMKYVFMALVLLEYAWRLFGFYLSALQMQKPLPACVQGIYDDEQYARWVAYTHERRRLGLISGAVSTLLMVAVLAFDLPARLYGALGLSGYGGDALLVAIFVLGLGAVDIIPDYISTFRIEEKYGFNRTTKKPFWGDTVKNALISLVLLEALAVGAALFYDLIGLWLVVAVFAVLVLVVLLSSAFALPLQKLFYRFDPLGEGSLRDRIEQLFVANGYEVRSIYVMNASKRTTRANAFCAGLGRAKKIALFDNLVSGYTEDEIVAVFAHELGHDKHKDTATLVLLNTVIYAVTAALIGLLVATPDASLSLGFADTQVAVMVMLLFMAVMGPVMTLLMIPVNLISRHMERRADTFAVKCGLGRPLTEALKRLSRDNFANLNPHPFLSAIGDSHPTVGERVQVIERAMADLDASGDPVASGDPDA